MCTFHFHKIIVLPSLDLLFKLNTLSVHASRLVWLTIYAWLMGITLFSIWKVLRWPITHSTYTGILANWRDVSTQEPGKWDFPLAELGILIVAPTQANSSLTRKPLSVRISSPVSSVHKKFVRGMTSPPIRQKVIALAGVIPIRNIIVFGCL